MCVWGGVVCLQLSVQVKFVVGVGVGGVGGSVHGPGSAVSPDLALY